MRENLEICKYLSRKELSGLPVKIFRVNSYILTYDERKVIYVTQGEARAVRYEGGREIVFPVFFQEGSFLGAHNKFLFDNMDWDFQAVTDVEGIVFSEKNSERYIFSRIEFFKYYMKKVCKAVERGTRGFYIQSRGGAKSHFAYLLMESEGEDGIPYKRYLHFSHILGISESMLYRITRELTGKGIIEKNRSRIKILQRERLREYYEEYLYF